MRFIGIEKKDRCGRSVSPVYEIRRGTRLNKMLIDLYIKTFIVEKQV